jgi:hypothetical protein
VEKVEGWKDSVHCAAWSADGQHLALADMSGVIKVKYFGTVYSNTLCTVQSDQLMVRILHRPT